MPEPISFEEFRSSWIQEISTDSPSTAELGRRFVHKLFTQWKNVSSPSDDLIYVDGPGDGGIDLAYLDRTVSDDDESMGDVWYLVQGKFGSSARGAKTIIEEGQKLVETLDISGARLSGLTDGLVAKITQFMRKADSDSGDRLVFVYASDQPLKNDEKRALDDVRAIGRSRFGNLFDAEAVSIETIYLNNVEDFGIATNEEIKVNISATLSNSGEHLLVGAVPLLDLYEFLSDYRSRTENIDQLYEKNVRLFLGGRGKVNKGMKATLLEDPGQFGLYNNGITFVVNDFRTVGQNQYELTEPFVVNGCQTTRTIWEVFQQKLESGGTGTDESLEKWKKAAKNGVVVAKIVRVGKQNEKLLHNITRYTNSQNAVKDKDFITLDQGFHTWKLQMANRFSIFLEVQRGAEDARKAYQKQNPNSTQFRMFANAFDLLKVYAAGWFRDAGRAFARNTQFVPGGKVFKKIVEETPGFGAEDLYAAFLLQSAADDFGFGRNAQKISRRLTRFLFYLVAVDLLKDILIRANMDTSPTALSAALIKLKESGDEVPLRELLDAAVAVVDEYLTQGEPESVFNEPKYTEHFNSNLNGFLKWEKLGTAEETPVFASLLAIHKRTLGRGSPSPRESITTALQEQYLT